MVSKNGKSESKRKSEDAEQNRQSESDEEAPPAVTSTASGSAAGASSGHQSSTNPLKRPKSGQSEGKPARRPAASPQRGSKRKRSDKLASSGSSGETDLDEEKSVLTVPAATTEQYGDNTDDEVTDDNGVIGTDKPMTSTDDLFGSDDDRRTAANAATAVGRKSPGQTVVVSGNGPQNHVMERSNLRRPVRSRVAFVEDSQSSQQQLVPLPRPPCPHPVARQARSSNGSFVAAAGPLMVRGCVDKACWYECGTNEHLSNIATVRYPKMVCKPCNASRRAWQGQCNGKGLEMKKAASDFQTNQQAKYKEIIRAGRITVVDGAELCRCCFFSNYYHELHRIHLITCMRQVHVSKKLLSIVFIVIRGRKNHQQIVNAVPQCNHIVKHAVYIYTLQKGHCAVAGTVVDPALSGDSVGYIIHIVLSLLCIHFDSAISANDMFSAVAFSYFVPYDIIACLLYTSPSPRDA